MIKVMVIHHGGYAHYEYFRALRYTASRLEEELLLQILIDA